MVHYKLDRNCNNNDVIDSKKENAFKKWTYMKINPKSIVTKHQVHSSPRIVVALTQRVRSWNVQYLFELVMYRKKQNTVDKFVKLFCISSVVCE